MLTQDIKMNEIQNKYLLAANAFMLKIHLR